MDATTAEDTARNQRGRSGDFGPLITARDVLATGFVGETLASTEALVAMARYVADFLTAPHPKLGRPGAVCPYAARAVLEDCIHLTSCKIDDVGPAGEARIAAGMLELQHRLARLQAGDAEPRYRAIVAVFPNLAEPAGAQLIERVQRALKLSCIEQRLMIGQFFPSCPEPGLRSADFRPLQSPVISLAIRNIAISDAPFMIGRRDYVQAYLRIFGEAGAERIDKALRSRCPAQRAAGLEPAGALGA